MQTSGSRSLNKVSMVLVGVLFRTRELLAGEDCVLYTTVIGWIILYLVHDND